MAGRDSAVPARAHLLGRSYLHGPKGYHAPVEVFAKIAGSIFGSFILAFIATWLFSRPVRWIVVKVAPNKRELAALCALATMVCVALVTWKGDTIYGVCLLLSIGINFLLDWAWAKYPYHHKRETPNAITPERSKGDLYAKGP